MVGAVSGSPSTEVQLETVYVAESEKNDDVAAPNAPISESDATSMMVKLSERITPDDFKKELSVGWTLAPFPELSAQSTSDEKAESDGDAQSLASACFSSDVETIFNAQMTATRIQVWKWAVVCSGVTFVGVGLAKLIFPELNLTGQPSTVYDSDAVGPYGLFQLGIALAIQFFKDFLFF